MSDIFISYRSTHYSQALALRQDLESRGFSCWMAPENIPGGSNYAREIPRAIHNCRIFVLLLTDDAQSDDSIWVPRELDMAVNKQKLILPIAPADFRVNDFFQFYLCFCQSYTGAGSWFQPPSSMIQRIREHLDGRPETRQPRQFASNPAPEPVPNPAPQFNPQPQGNPQTQSNSWAQPARSSWQESPAQEPAFAVHDPFGDGGAQAKTEADAYYYGSNGQQSYAQARDLYQQAAEAGNADAMWMLGNLHFFGLTGAEDHDTACRWYQQAAKAGHLAAMYDLGRCHYHGRGDYPQAFRWFKEAAQGGSIEAMIDLSRCYLRGEGTEKNAAQAVFWLEKAVREDSAKAKFEMAMMYFRGDGVARDYGRATKLFRAVANQGYGDAQYYLGYCYHAGKGVIPDARRAQSLYRQAMENGYTGEPYDQFKP
ncbi:MAG: TIR domain-containing protein [Ruminococcaceae bacterium]|nr:TIR domain-containing protein [Oscillospiraceae bacterium]